MDSRWVASANSESFTTIQGPKTKREFQVREHTFGVLVPDENHPLSAVSVSNSSLSIDLWAGCRWRCAYCHVQDSARDLADGGLRMPTRPQHRTKFSVDEILDALVQHPFFSRDQSVISIGTASTEPFAPGEVVDSTFEIMHGLIRRGLRNPIWIVTKGGVPKGRGAEFAEITKAIRGLMISLCWADNPQHIEPVHNNRFLNSEEAKAAGATISWYMRPMVPEWGGRPENIERMMLWVKQNYGSVIDMIVPGGLRWTQGIEYGLTEVRDIAMPDIPRDDNIKDLPEETWELIMKLGAIHFPDTPIYRHSSCALTAMLGIPSLAGVQESKKEDCLASKCPVFQRGICAHSPLYTHDIVSVQKVVDDLGVPVTVTDFKPSTGPVTEPSLQTFTYAIQRTVLKRLSQGG